MKPIPSPLFDTRGRPVQLGALLAQGGEGAIYPCDRRGDILAKVFHPASPELGRARGEKLQAMLMLADLRAHPRLAWPQELLRSAQGEARGFMMRRVSGVTLVPLTALALMKTRLPSWGPAHVCRVVHDVAAICAALEARHVFIGDINLGNFLADPVTAETSAIDCDSYQITVNERKYPCRVFTPDFQSPEVLAQSGQLASLGPAQFRFSGALLFFTLLTAGGHPYQVKNGKSPAENIVAGRHFLGGKGTATGATTGAIWSRYMAQPPRVLALFKRAFIAGHSQDPAARPSFAEWVSAFRSHYAELIHAA